MENKIENLDIQNTESPSENQQSDSVPTQNIPSVSSYADAPTSDAINPDVPQVRQSLPPEQLTTTVPTQQTVNVTDDSSSRQVDENSPDQETTAQEPAQINQTEDTNSSIQQQTHIEKQVDNSELSPSQNTSSPVVDQNKDQESQKVIIKEIIREVPVEKIVEKEVIKEIPDERVVVKEVPVVKIVEKIVIKEIPVEKLTEKIVEKEIKVFDQDRFNEEIKKRALSLLPQALQSKKQRRDNRVQKFLEFIQNEKTATSGQLQVHLKLSAMTVLRYANLLIRSGKIKYHGKRRSRVYIAV